MMSETGFTLDKPYALTCPECGGALFPAERNPYVEFRCHIGHRYVWTEFVKAHQTRIEATLGTAMVLLKERAEMCRQLIDAAAADAAKLRAMEKEAIERVEQIKQLLEAPRQELPKAPMTTP